MTVTLGTTQLTSNSVFLTAIRNAVLPQVVYSTTKRGGYQGNKLVQPTFGSYKFVFEWVIIGSSFSDLSTQRRAFMYALGLIHSTGSQTLKITTDDGVSMQVDIKAFDVTSDITADDGNSCTLATILEAEYPFLQNSAAVNQDINIYNGGGFAIPFGIPFDMSAGHSTAVSITNNGNYPAYPIITFTGVLTNPTLTNNTTGETFSLAQTLADSSHSIVVDCFYKTVVLQPSGNNGRQYFTGTFLTIPVGTSSFTLGNANTTDGGKVTITYRDTFLGI